MTVSSSPPGGLPAWLVEGALVWERVDGWKPWKKYRVRRIKATRTCRSGYMVTLQKLEPPFYGWGREVDSGFCVEAFEHDPVPDVSWDGTRPSKGMDSAAAGPALDCSSCDRGSGAGVPDGGVEPVPRLPEEQGAEEAMKHPQQILDHLKEAAEGFLAVRRQGPPHVVEDLVERARAMNMPRDQEDVVCSALYAAEEAFNMNGDIS